MFLLTRDELFPGYFICKSPETVSSEDDEPEGDGLEYGDSESEDED